MNDSIDGILSFWFGDMTASDGEIAHRQAALWWRGDAATDESITARFGPLLRRAIIGELDSWTSTAPGRLALIILLDQFSRVLFRGTPAAFAQDRIALAHSLQCQGQGQDRDLRPVQRLFVYMPMEHAEALMVQDESVRRFEALCELVEPKDRPEFEKALEFARRHRDAILRFDRFPHRNDTLDRVSTPEERAFLEEPGSRF